MAATRTVIFTDTQVNVTVHTVTNVTFTSGQPYNICIAANPALIYEPISSVQYNGVSLTPAGSGVGGNNDKVFIYESDASGTGADGSAHSVVVTYTDQADQSHLIGRSFAGAHATAPFADYVTASGAVSPATVGVTNLTPGDLAIDIVGTGETITVGAGQTQDANLNSGGHRAGASNEAGTGTTTMSWTLDSAGDWFIAGRRIVQAVAGGGASSVQNRVMRVVRSTWDHIWKLAN